MTLLTEIEKQINEVNRHSENGDVILGYAEIKLESFVSTNHSKGKNNLLLHSNYYILIIRLFYQQ